MLGVHRGGKGVARSLTYLIHIRFILLFCTCHFAPCIMDHPNTRRHLTRIYCTIYPTGSDAESS
jgi:hypothetical protein